MEQPFIEDLTKKFSYERWANHAVLENLKTWTSPPEKARKIMAHIFATQALWHDRLQQLPQSVPVWPDWTLAESAEFARKIETLWTDLQSFDLQRTIQYANSMGERFTSVTVDVLTHVLFHGAYHRGQIATIVREAGGEPAYTDYIYAVRTGQLR